MPEHEETSEVGEKKHQPTAHRLHEARQAGNVARSGDVTSILIVMGGFAALALTAGCILNESRKMMVAMLDGRQDAIVTPGALWSAAAGWCVELAGLVTLVALGGAAAAVIVALAMGVRARMANVGLDIGRLSVSRGLGRMVSRQALFAAAMSILKIAAAGGAAFVVIRRQMPRIVSMTAMGMSGMAAEAGGLVKDLVITVGAVLAALAAGDYLYRLWEHRQGLKMTDRELREDLRRSEGDVQVRAWRRRLANEILDRNLNG